MTQASAEPVELLPHLPPSLCAACIGRVFARREPAASNADRGRQIKPGAPEPSDECPVCEGIPARLDNLAKMCLDTAHGHEFTTFLVGSVFYDEVRAREDELYERLAEAVPELRRASKEGEAAVPAFAWAEYLKAEVNRELGKRIEAATGKRVDFQRPDITFQVDTRLDHVRLQVASLYVRGRYRKHDRSLPQTRWPCRACGGIGCRQCGYGGKTYESSVEEQVAAPFMEASGAQAEAFHGMGREDIDARMLGTGRPFVLELKEPKRRALEWEVLAKDVGGRSKGLVEAFDVAPTDAAAPARYKAADPDKTYVARCVAESSIDPGRLISVLPSLREVLLDQRTPERVAHRRADRVRARRIHEVKLLEHDNGRFALEIRAESGTYIKEFVSGDQGRTRPSLSEALGVPVRVEELDVVDVDWKE